MGDPRSSVHRFIVETFLFGQDEGLSGSTSFLEEGIVDSTGVLQIVSFLEQTFAITVSDSELTPDNLDSVDAIAAFIQRKRGAR